MIKRTTAAAEQMGLPENETKSCKGLNSYATFH